MVSAFRSGNTGTAAINIFVVAIEDRTSRLACPFRPHFVPRLVMFACTRKRIKRIRLINSIKSTEIKQTCTAAIAFLRRAFPSLFSPSLFLSSLTPHPARSSFFFLVSVDSLNAPLRKRRADNPRRCGRHIVRPATRERCIIYTRSHNNAADDFNAHTSVPGA